MTSLSLRSVHVVSQIVHIVRRKFRQLSIGWEGIDNVEDFWLSFPEIKVLPSLQSNDKHLSFKVTKAGIHKLIQDNQASSFSGETRVALWSERLGPGFPVTLLWPNI